MSKATEKIKEELLAMVPPTLYFFVALHIVALIRTLMVKGTGITLDTTTSVPWRSRHSSSASRC